METEGFHGESSGISLEQLQQTHDGQQSALFMGSPSLDTLFTWQLRVLGVTGAAHLTVNLFPRFQTCGSRPPMFPCWFRFIATCRKPIDMHIQIEVPSDSH